MLYQLVPATTGDGNARRFCVRNAVALALTVTFFAITVAMLCMPATEASPVTTSSTSSLPSSTVVDALCSNVYRVYAFWGGGIEGFFNCVDHYANLNVTNLE